MGQEFLVNQTTAGVQQFSQPSAMIATAQEQSVRSMAMDHSGDFVTVWTAADGNGTGVYMRLFGRDN